MTTFEIVTPAAPATARHADHCDCGLPDPEYCACPVTGARTVLFSIDAGSVSLICSACRRGLPGEPDPMELLHLEPLPMTLTHHFEQYSGPDGTEYDEWYDLAPIAEAENVQELADVVDRIRNIGGLGS